MKIRSNVLLLCGLLLCASEAFAQAPSSPTSLSVSVTGLRADLSWTNPGTQTWLAVERKTGAGSFTEIAVLMSFVAKFYDDSVRPSTTYTYRVKACNGSGCSSPSSEQAAVTGSAPTATGSVTVSSATAIVGETVLIDARASTGFCKRPRTDSGNEGKPSVTLSFGDGHSTELLASAHLYTDPGTYTIRLNGYNCSGVAATEATTTITVNAQPTCTTTQTLTDSGNATTNGSNLQTAIATAKTLNTGSAYPCVALSGSWSQVINGPITLDVPTGNNWIRIYWTGLTVPRNKRVHPGDFPGTAPIVVNNTLANQPAFTTGASDPDPATHHYILQGLHVKRRDSNFAQILVYLGNVTAPTLSALPHHLIVERTYFDGGTGLSEWSKDGISIVGNYVTVMDSYFAEFKRDTGADPTGFTISGGRGPISCWNNEAIADGENYSENNSTPNLRWTATISSPTNTSATLSSVTNLQVDDQISLPVHGGKTGSAFSTIVRSISGNNITFDPLTVVPDNGGTAQWDSIISFVEYRRNFAWKPLKWRASDPSYVGVLFDIKNLWETKSGRYHVLKGNVFFQNWIVYQPYAIVIGSGSNEAGPANVIRQFEFSENLLWNMNTGPSITNGMPANEGDTIIGQQNSDFILRNNIHLNVGINWNATVANDQIHYGQGRAWNGTGEVVVSTQVVRVYNIHNTYDEGTPDNSSTMFSGLTSVCGLLQGGGSFDSMNMNNIQQDQGYGYFNQCSLADQAAAIARWFAPGDASVWTKNLIVNTNGHTYPAAALTTTGWTDEFVDHSNGNLTLASATTGKGAGTDGADVGADTTALRNAIGASSLSLKTATIKTVTGDWSGVASIIHCNWSSGVRCQ